MGGLETQRVWILDPFILCSLWASAGMRPQPGGL